jgi:hypothetical protein
MRGCHRMECHVSTGICGRITFGTGELSDLGYWQWPCPECAQWHDNDRDNRRRDLRYDPNPATWGCDPMNPDVEKWLWSELPAWPSRS